MLPAVGLTVRVVENGEKKVGLWLPLFLIWPVVYVVAMVVYPFLAIAVVCLKVADKREALKKAAIVLMAIPFIFRLPFVLRGLRVEVDEQNEQVLVDFH
jgi:hypothetical protein